VLFNLLDFRLRGNDQGVEMTAHYFSPPRISLRFLPIWRRHFLVWRKVAATSILGHLADPIIYLLGLGYGLGSLLPSMGGTSYMTFLAAGTVCYSTMNSASFEALYSGFSRMHEQRTWDAILNTPVTLDDVVLAETLWAASKSLMAGVAVLLVIWLLGLSHSLLSLWVIPLALLVGLCFAAVGLIMTALAPSYDFFMYYFTLVVTPMMLLCGVFFPASQLPAVVAKRFRHPAADACSGPCPAAAERRAARAGFAPYWCAAGVYPVRVLCVAGIVPPASIEIGKPSCCGSRRFISFSSPAGSPACFTCRAFS
jgi:lipooligosaccharide transport system permease protein